MGDCSFCCCAGTFPFKIKGFGWCLLFISQALQGGVLYFLHVPESFVVIDALETSQCPVEISFSFFLLFKIKILVFIYRRFDKEGLNWQHVPMTHLICRYFCGHRVFGPDLKSTERGGRVVWEKLSQYRVSGWGLFFHVTYCQPVFRHGNVLFLHFNFPLNKENTHWQVCFPELFLKSPIELEIQRLCISSEKKRNGNVSSFMIYSESW